MAALRPGRTTRAIERPWTRYSTKKTKSYIPTLPVSKIHIFNMGAPSPTYDTTINLVAKNSVQIRDNALESSRIVAHKFLETKLAKNYYLKILLYPHQILREKPIAQGAGADRYSRGMKLAFGKPVRTAVQIKKDQVLMTLQTYKANIPIVKQALKRAASKLSTPMRIVVAE